MKIEYRMHIPTILVVVASYVALYVTAFGLFATGELIALTLAGALFLLMAIYGFAYVEAKGSLQLSLAYVGVQAVLSLGIHYASHSSGVLWLITLPLVSHGVVLLSRNWLILLCSVLTVSYSLPAGLATDPAGALQSGVLFVSAVVFVVVFTQVMLREARARIEVEVLAGQLGDANLKLREYAAQAEELATTKERNRLAREIHDSLGHYLTVANIQLEAAQAVFESDRLRSLDAISKAQGLVREGLAEVRRSVAALRAAPTDNRTLTEALNSLVEECRAAGIVAELVVTGPERPLLPQAELTLYRAAQEGLTNVRKHAHASRVGVCLDYTRDDRVRLTVEDNGVGMDKGSGGFGLMGLRERALLLGGVSSVNSIPGKGFTVEVELPA